MADGEYKRFDHERKSLTHPRTARTSRRRITERERERERRTIPDSSCTRTTPPQTTTTMTTRSLVPGLLPAQTRPRSTTKPHLLVLLFLLVLFSAGSLRIAQRISRFLNLERARTHTQRQKTHNRTQTATKESTVRARATRERETSAAAKQERMTRTRGRKKGYGAKKRREDLRICEVATSALTRRETHTLSLSLSRLSVWKKKHARQPGKRSGTQPTSQPASQRAAYAPASRPSGCLQFLLVLELSISNQLHWRMLPENAGMLERDCRRCCNILWWSVFLRREGGREGGREGVRQKRREEKRDTVAAAAAAAHALLSSQQFLKKSAATAPPPSLPQNQQQKTNIRCSITDDNSLLLHEEHHHHHHQ